MAGLMGALAGCSLVPGGSQDRSSRLVASTDSIGIAWLPSGIYSVDTANGSANAELQRIDPDSGAVTSIPWPDAPCAESNRQGPFAGTDDRVYVSQVCNFISEPRERTYLAYDPGADAWSTLTRVTWSEPSHHRLAWNAEAQEGLFTTPEQSCSTLYRLTSDGPELIRQVVPTPHGDVDLQAGLSMTERAGCLRDGRVLGAPASARGQVALMISLVRGGAGPDRLSARSALVLADWTPGRTAPLSGFRTLAQDIKSASPPAWSPDGTAVFFSSGSRSIMRVDVDSGQRREIAAEGADELTVSPDGTRVALRVTVVSDDDEVISEIRIVTVSATR